MQIPNDAKVKDTIINLITESLMNCRLKTDVSKVTLTFEMYVRHLSEVYLMLMQVNNTEPIQKIIGNFEKYVSEMPKKTFDAKVQELAQELFKIIDFKSSEEK